ncbi:spore germination protein (amino acid permease) [Bacillus cereus VD133]|uniref:Spore germination protein (Amino acid permease) n=1 Tax=Bacillus cereus VD133 TaxID=1053233 RepID=A0A9W5PJF9_BACCE|nr:endospore germination permease [Bacillus cereus]EOO24099.1 spore germination protein (amino acid permease) [Bacillus cereus VD133]
MERSQISNRQLMILITLITISSPIFFLPSEVSKGVGRDGWYIVIFSGLIGMFNVMIFIWLERIFPKKSLIQIIQGVFGRFVGGIVNVLMFFYFIDVGSWVLREFAEFLLANIEPTTPLFVYLIIGIGMAAYAVSCGLGTFARVSEVIFPIPILTYISIFLLTLNLFHFEYLLPALENGFIKPLSHSLSTITFLGDVICVSMIINYVKTTKRTAFYALTGMGITVILFLLAVLSSVLVMGAESTAKQTYPILSLISNISIGGILDRFDVLVVAFWMIALFVKITSYLWASTEAACQIFSIKDRRYIIIPILLVYIVSARYKVDGYVDLSTFYSTHAMYFLTFQAIVPLFILLSSLLKQKWKRGKAVTS